MTRATFRATPLTALIAALFGLAACGGDDASSAQDATGDGGTGAATDAAHADKSDSGKGGGDAGGGTVGVDGGATEEDASVPSGDGGAKADGSVVLPKDAGAPPDSGGNTGGSAKIVAGYYPNWTPSPVRIRDVDSHYNLIYLFAAKPVGGAPGTTGAVQWDPPGDGKGAATNLKADIAFARSSQGRKIIMSIGGAGAGMSFPNRTKSQTFLDSVITLDTQLGGIDGIDWNTFEGSQAPDTTEMIWISQQLKSHFPGFLITAPPAPWNGVDKTFCAQMVAAGALDYAAPQYYDGPNLATQSYITGSIDEWSKLLGEDKVVVGFGIWDQPNYMSIGDAVSTWNAVAKSHPNLRGAFDWQIHIDEAAGWPFAKQVGPLVKP